MKRSRLLIITLILTLLLPWQAKAQEPTNYREQERHSAAERDSIRISLLTCASGAEVYSLYGHTAIRYENYTRGIDAVFNYGMFSFDVPFFVLRFVLGKTDYWLGVTDFDRFAAEYRYLGRDVWQQTLNLTQEEKERLVGLLIENYSPENRVYRYNIFYDNCSTRVRDIIERAITAPLTPPKGGAGGYSFRSLLHHYTEGHPWVRFGIDLCLGSEADRPITPREMMFVPFCLQEAFRGATSVDEVTSKQVDEVTENSSTRPLVYSFTRKLVSSEEKIIETGKTPADFVTGGITPMQAALLLLAITVVATVYGVRKGKTLWGLDLLLYLAGGIVGCILTFLALFSTHPAVSPNYLLLIYHPFHLLCLPCMLRRVRKRKLSRYMVANSVVLIFFIGLWPVIPQKFPLTVLPLALCLLIRAASNIYLSRRVDKLTSKQVDKMTSKQVDELTSKPVDKLTRNSSTRPLVYSFTRKLVTSSILALTFSGLQAQPVSIAPKLVVTLTIDQLRTDYMEAFSSLYGEKGFKRLLREGKVFRQTEFSFNGTDRASAIAAIYTGTTPSLNGIVAENWLDANTLRPTGCVDDPDFMGNYTHESSSPAKLLTSTIADELKIATRNKGLVYAIAPFRDAAILGAGHTANGAFWLNTATGKWCGTTYYSEFPWWLSQYNDRKSPDFRIKDMVWTPALPFTQYTFLPEWRNLPFKYRLEDEKLNKYRYLVTTPFVNEEVNLLVEELLNKSTIGQDDITDLLSLTYYAGNYNHRSTQECGMELQDAYVRLDRSLATLLEMIEKKVGLQNVLFCICSTGYADPEAADVGLYKIPGGEFYMNRCAALLNMYLMATYGEGHYVEAYHGQQIYLNHKLIEQKQLNLTEIQEKSEEFLIQFSGVNEVYSARRLLLGAWSPRLARIRNGYHRKRSGDLLIEVLPGWTLVQENTSDNRVVRTAEVTAPLILLGAGIKAETVRTPVDIDRLAPTLSKAMRIRAPNASEATPLDL